MMGYHIFINAYQCNNTTYLSSARKLAELISDVCYDCNLNIVGKPAMFTRGTNITAVVLLSESHISVHSNGLNCWIDIFCCSGEDTAERAYKLFIDKLNPKILHRNSCQR